MTFNFTDYLTEDERMIRTEVFVEEQKFNEEFDTQDNDSYHLVMYDNGKPIACCRFFTTERQGVFMLGRFAVRKEYRGKHIGEKVMKEAEKLAKEKGCKVMALSAQLRASGFYEKQGYAKMGEIYLDEYCEHIHMEKSL